MDYNLDVTVPGIDDDNPYFPHRKTARQEKWGRDSALEIRSEKVGRLAGTIR